MSLSRRSLMQYAGAGCALTFLPSRLDAASALRRYQVRDTVALPRFTVGDQVIADTGVDRYSGPGLYLYPAWGEPRLYEVRAVAARLQFRNPGSHVLLWTQSSGFDSLFAGKVLEAAQAAAWMAEVPALAVPAKPGIV